MLAIADTMPSDTGLASPLLAFNQHGRCGCGCECVFLFSLSVMVTRKGVIFRPFHILGVLALDENGKVDGLPWEAEARRTTKRAVCSRRYKSNSSFERSQLMVASADRVYLWLNWRGNLGDLPFKREWHRRT